MIDIKQAHIDVGYYTHLSNNAQRNICVAKIPENIFEELPEVTAIYEVENKLVTIYQNKQKVHSKQCPEYAKRIIIWGHILHLLSVRNADNIPLIVDNNGTIETDCTNFKTIEPVVRLIESPLESDLELESMLLDAIEKFSKNKTEPPKEVLEGFTTSLSFFKELHNG